MINGTTNLYLSNILNWFLVRYFGLNQYKYLFLIIITLCFVNREGGLLAKVRVIF